MGVCGDGGGEELGESVPCIVSFLLWPVIVGHVCSNKSQGGLCGFECDCEESATDWSEVCDAGCDVWGSYDGDACVGLGVLGCVSTVEECVAHDSVHIRGCEVGLWQDQYIESVGLHVLDKCVHLGTFSEACGVPATNVKLVFGGDFDVML